MKHSKNAKKWFYRHQAKIPLYRCIRAGIKGFITITALSGIGYLTGMTLVMAPFGASCILIYSSPNDEYSQPINIIGGYLVATILSLALAYILPNEWWVYGFILAMTITVMAYFRVTHPPAGAIPLLVFIYKENFDLLATSIIGSLIIVSCALILHNVPPTFDYPRNPNKKYKNDRHLY